VWTISLSLAVHLHPVDVRVFVVNVADFVPNAPFNLDFAITLKGLWPARPRPTPGLSSPRHSTSRRRPRTLPIFPTRTTYGLDRLNRSRNGENVNASTVSATLLVAVHKSQLFRIIYSSLNLNTIAHYTSMVRILQKYAYTTYTMRYSLYSRRPSDVSPRPWP